MGLFDGKVVAITGAGGGLGRAYAHAFAREGAKVVVNDLGGAADGSGEGGMAMAEKVVAEIKEMGFEAVPNFASVADEEGAQSIVQSAVDTFGRLDVLVSNAGILRDRTLVKMTMDLWEPIIEVHLKGTYLCVRYAALQMIDQGEGGRIITTTSLAGLMGNFGQTNYASAKAGIAGFTRTAAQELRRSRITINAVAPLAKTRLTDDIEAVPDDAKVEFICPLVLFLASDLAKDVTGRIFGAHANHLFEYRMEMTRGIDKGEEEWSVQEIADKLKEISKTEADRVKEEMKAAPAAGAAVDPATKALKVFEAMITAFLPEKAGDWKANLHFEVDGCGEFTMKVGDGQVSVAQGLDGKASCVVKMSDETFFGMAEGKVDGTQAFMQGKITATNMSDMIKYGTAFHQKKAQAAVKEALASLATAGAPAAVDPATKALKVFEAMITAFMPDKAKGWKANLHFKVDGCGEFTMKVEGDAVSVAKGLDGDATCVIEMSDETFFGMADGKVDGTQAFMQGKITATNMGDMVKYGTAFHQKRAQAAVKEALAALEGPARAGEEAAEEEPPRPEGLNRACLGKVYKSPPYFVAAEHTIAYAKATNDANRWYVDEERDGGIVAPVMFPMRVLYSNLEQAVLDPELNADVVMLLHGEQDLRFHDLIRPGDLLDTQGEVAHMEKKATGEILDIKGSCIRDGKVVVESTVRCFIRQRDDDGTKKKEPKEEPALPELAFTEDMLVREDQSLDYAEASLDRNPIHIDPEVGKAAGHGGVIIHGLCTMAFSSQAIIKHAADGNPRRLKRLKVRFNKPVRPKETVTTQAWKTGETGDVVEYGFRMVNQDGVVVVSEGVAEVAKA